MRPHGPAQCPCACVFPQKSSERPKVPSQLSSSATPGGCCGGRLRGRRATGVFTAFDSRSLSAAVLSSILSSNELSSSATRVGSSIAEIEGNTTEVLLGGASYCRDPTWWPRLAPRSHGFSSQVAPVPPPLALELSSTRLVRLGLSSLKAGYSRSARLDVPGSPSAGPRLPETSEIHPRPRHVGQIEGSTLRNSRRSYLGFRGRPSPSDLDISTLCPIHSTRQARLSQFRDLLPRYGAPPDPETRVSSVSLSRPSTWALNRSLRAHGRASQAVGCSRSAISR
jgi:hypothetical protein